MIQKNKFDRDWIRIHRTVGVGTLSLLAVPEVLRGPFPVYHCRLVPVRSSSCHTVRSGLTSPAVRDSEAPGPIHLVTRVRFDPRHS